MTTHPQTEKDQFQYIPVTVTRVPQQGHNLRYFGKGQLNDGTCHI